MKVCFDPKAWDQHLFWRGADKAILRKIHTLIAECQRHPFEGTGKPEPLKNNFSGYWSRRINREHRLVYAVTDQGLLILQCRYHY